MGLLAPCGSGLHCCRMKNMLLVLCTRTLLGPAVGNAAVVGEALLCFWCSYWGSCMLVLKIRTFNLVFIKTNDP